MLYTVHHANGHGFRFEFEPGGWVTGQGEFQTVAVVEAQSLDQVYEKTNTIECLWTENPQVKALPNGARQRSTSVGDVITTPEGKAFMVAPAGFEEIDYNQANLRGVSC